MAVSKKALAVPCNECPFRKDSIQGYLGPWPSPQDLVEQAFSEAGFACHKTVKVSGVPEGTSICAGSLACANLSAKQYRDHILRNYQTMVGIRDDVWTAWDFVKYHGKRRRNG